MIKIALLHSKCSIFIKMKILANDGISESGKSTLENAGFEVVITQSCPRAIR